MALRSPLVAGRHEASLPHDGEPNTGGRRAPPGSPRSRFRPPARPPDWSILATPTAAVKDRTGLRPHPGHAALARPSEDQPMDDLKLRAAALHRDALVWDSHACLPLHPDADLGALERHRANGVDFVSINIGMDMNPLAADHGGDRELSRAAAGAVGRVRSGRGRERRAARQSGEQARGRVRSRGRRAAWRAAGDGAAVLRSRRPPDPPRLQPQQQHRRRLLRRGHPALERSAGASSRRSTKPAC